MSKWHGSSAELSSTSPCRARGRGWLLGLLLTGWALPTNAHHSFTSVYDRSREVTLEGVVKEFLFVHPHPFLVFTTEGGHSWRAEMDNRFELEDIGMTATTFKPGDRVVVRGSPGREQHGILYLWRLDRPADGMRYEQVGSTPRLEMRTAR